MADTALAALLGFALGVIWQEIHFRKISAELDELTRQFDRLTRGTKP